jgi:hypothetical protein
MTDIDQGHVTNAEALRRVMPTAVADYFVRTGWARMCERNAGTVWTRQFDGDVRHLFQPEDPPSPLYALRMHEMLATLAADEGRSQLAVLTDLYGADDVAEVRQAGNAESPSIALIAAERRRQIETEGWTPDHDDLHDGGELVEAARCYAYAAQVAQRHDIAEWFGLDADGRIKSPDPIHGRWPWRREGWKATGDAVRDLVKAASLIAAEIDRLLRLGNR